MKLARRIILLLCVCVTRATVYVWLSGSEKNGGGVGGGDDDEGE